MAIAAFVIVRECVVGEVGEGGGKGGVVRDFGGFVCSSFLLFFEGQNLGGLEGRAGEGG